MLTFAKYNRLQGTANAPVESLDNADRTVAELGSLHQVALAGVCRRGGGRAQDVLQVGPQYDIAQLVVVRARRRHLRVAPAPEPVGAHLLGKLLDRVDPAVPDLLGESVRHGAQTVNKRVK